jgi:hypothetical protein
MRERLMITARQSALGTAALLAAAAVLAACVMVAGTTRPACAGGCPAPVFRATPQAYAKFASPATGLRFARGLFAGVSLPPGARPVTAPPELRIPPGWGLSPTSDVGQVWEVPMPAVQVGWFFARHPPRGTTMTSSGSGSATVSAVTVSALYYQARSVPAVLTEGQVVIVVDPAGPGRTFIRVDAQAVL